MALTKLTTKSITGDTLEAGDLAANSVDSSELVDGSIDTSHLSDDAVTLAKMASGTDGNIISYDASGNPVAIATGSDGQVLTSAGAGQPPAFEAAPSSTADNYFASSGISSKDLGTGLHIKTNDSGGDVHNDADELVIENSSTGGITILSGTSAEGRINFGDSGDNDIGRVNYSHASNYMTFYTNASEAMRIDSSQKLLVGKTSSNTATVGLELEGANNYIFVTRDSASACFIGRNNNDSSPGKVFQGQNANGSESSWIKQNGTGYMPNGWSTSDSNGKNIIGSVSHGLDKLKQVEAKEFYWKTREEYKDDDEEVINGTKKVGEVKFDDTNFDDNKHYGVIAQELQSVLPDIVHDKEPELRVDYNALLMVAINAIKELSTEIDTLKTKVTALENA